MKIHRFIQDDDRYFKGLAGAVFLLNLLLLGGLLWLVLPFLRHQATHLLLFIAGMVTLVAAQAALAWRMISRMAALRRQQQRHDLEQMFLDAFLHDTEESIYLKDRDHRILMVNDHMPRSMDTTADAMIGKTDAELFDAAFGAITAQEEDRIFATGKSMINTIESRDLETGQPYWTQTTKVPVRVDGEIHAILGITREFGEIARVQETLEYSATHDSLTGLFNRYGINRALEQILAAEQPLALLFIDVDDFKQYNDTRGHDYGDDVLRAVGNRLEAVLRKGDCIGRYAGDEFVVLARRVEAEAEARVVAGKVFDAFKQPILVAGESCQVSLSIGVSYCQVVDTAAQKHHQANHLITTADRAMYRVKQSGKHGVQFAGNE